MKLKRRIVQARKAIQQKYNRLKADRFTKELDFVQTYKPLIEPLSNIQKNFEQKHEIKSEKMEKERKEEEEEEEEDGNVFRRPSPKRLLIPRSSTPAARPFIQRPKRRHSISGISPLSRLPFFHRNPPPSLIQATPSFLETTVIGEIEPEEEEEERPSTSSRIDSSSVLLDRSGAEKFLEQYAALPRIYVERMIRDTENAIDTTYGIHYNIDTDKWMMGNTLVDIEGEDMIINGVRYKGTEGLYDLIIMNEPDRRLFTQQDEENYRKILNATNVARRSYEAGEQLRGSKSKKYTQIIKRLLTYKPDSHFAFY
ncbi:hypothetical protein RI129_009604 [Pyrocoelia pectoralis]|uniref:DUF8207 domain-containing protein n=1 Tax=Pyrocoelia pectoralis TaxID=417401 RepID=A0AAN7ZF24_9COLE